MNCGKMGSRTDGPESRRWLTRPIIALQAVALKRDSIEGYSGYLSTAPSSPV